MLETEQIFLNALDEVLHDKKTNASIAAAEILNSENPADTVRALLDISRKQKIVPLIYDFLCTREIEIPESSISFLKHEIASYALTYYQNKYFNDYVCQILDSAHLPYALIKGILLSSLYKKPECRRFGDIDILINDRKAFETASALLTRHGFQKRPSNGDHHHEYTLMKNGRTYLIELHQNLISSQESTILNQKIKALYNSIELDGVLPATLDALYLLLHMLQHLLDAGFGIKLLCDWVLYLEQRTDEIDSSKLKELLEDLGIFPFARHITVFCVQYLGLTTYPKCFHFDTLTSKMKKAMDALSEDIFSGGEYGKNDSSRMIIMKGHFRLIDYFTELHRQTRKNYPKLWKTIIFLPVLWGMTGFRFLYNNKRIRHTDTRKILETTKRRQKLLENMDIHF